MLKIKYLVSDSLLSHIWTRHQTPLCEFTNYEEMVEKIKLTPRMWDTQIKIPKALKHISMTLCLNLNLIAFRRTRNYSEHNKCIHATSCYFPIYKFQNPMIKLISSNSNYFTAVNIIEHKNLFYIFNAALLPQFNPILINMPTTNMITFANECISTDTIQSVLNRESVDKAFSIAVYSTFSYVKHQSIKCITKNIIGFYEAKNAVSEDILHIFITPHLFKPTYQICQIFQNSKPNFNWKNIYSTTHLTEGENKSRTESHVNKDLLNQDFCICDHPDTNRYFSPTKGTFGDTFKNLGKNVFTLYITIIQ